MPETMIVGGMLAANAVCDIRKREILLVPTLITMAAGWIRIFADGSAKSGQWVPAVIPGVFLLVLSVVSAGKIGIGDGLAVCMIGTWCSMESVLFTLFFSFLFVPIAAVVIKAWRSPVRELPFMPFLFSGFLLEQILL